MNLRSRIDRLEQRPEPELGVALLDAWNAPALDWQEACVCFPCKPAFANECELEVAGRTNCPIHGKRFTEHESLSFRARWLPMSAPYEWLPDNVRAQYKKAWFASFPLGFLPVEGGFKDGKYFCRIVESAEWLAFQYAIDLAESGQEIARKNAIDRDQELMAAANWRRDE